MTVPFHNVMGGEGSIKYTKTMNYRMQKCFTLLKKIKKHSLLVKMDPFTHWAVVGMVIPIMNSFIWSSMASSWHCVLFRSATCLYFIPDWWHAQNTLLNQYSPIWDAVASLYHSSWNIASCFLNNLFWFCWWVVILYHLKQPITWHTLAELQLGPLNAYWA